LNARHQENPKLIKRVFQVILKEASSPFCHLVTENASVDVRITYNALMVD